MLPLERLTTLAAGKRPDRVPLILNLLEFGAAFRGVEPRSYYASGELVAETQIQLQKILGHDSLHGTFYGAMDAEILGAGAPHFPEGGPPLAGRMLIRTPDDLSKIALPDNIEAVPSFSRQLDCLRTLRAEAGGRVPVFVLLQGSFSKPCLLMGLEKWMASLVSGDRRFVTGILSLCSQLFRLQAQACLEAGADFIVYGNPVASAQFIPQAMFDTLALPSIRQDISSIASERLVYFSGGAPLVPRLASLMDNTSFRAYYLAPEESVAQAFRIVGNTALIVGALNDMEIPSWTAAELREQVGALVEAGKNRGGYMVGNMALGARLPLEQIHALVEAVHEFGQYA